MSNELATQHADSLVADILKRVEEGAPFGWIDQNDDSWYESREEAIAQGVEEDDITEASASNYLSDVPDIEYRVDSERRYKSAEILIGFGGPNVWIDTKRGTLNVAWWSDTVTRNLPGEFIDPLDDFLSELYDCI